MKELRFTSHALERMFERSISPNECSDVYENGETIENYPKDKPFPSDLRVGVVNGRVLHVVTAEAPDVAHVITAYEPDPNEWENDFKKRRKK